jgi:hypothetical protein
MGIYTTLTTNSQVIGPAAKPRVGLDRSSAEQLLNKALVFDPSIRTAFAAQDEVQTIPEQTDAGVGDTYTLTFTFPRQNAGKGLVFTTAGIAYDAVDTVIETAIDVAATAATWTAWTNADISVSMAAAAGLDDGTVTLTFDGASVTEEPFEITTLAATGFTSVGDAVRTTGGQLDRRATQTLYDLGVIEGTLQDSAEAPTWTRPTSKLLKRPRLSLIQDLAVQTVWEDGTDDAHDAVAALYAFAPR